MADNGLCASERQLLRAFLLAMADVYDRLLPPEECGRLEEAVIADFASRIIVVDARGLL